MSYRANTKAAVLECERQRTAEYYNDAGCSECGKDTEIYYLGGIIYCKDCLTTELKDTMKSAVRLTLSTYKGDAVKVAMNILDDMIYNEDMEDYIDNYLERA